MTASVKAFAKERLAEYKCPSIYRWIRQADVPMTASGKIKKHELCELFTSGFELTARRGVRSADLGSKLARNQDMAALLQMICSTASRVLSSETQGSIELLADTPFQDFGMSSIHAVAIRDAINQELISSAISLAPTAMFDYPTARDLAQHVLSSLGNGESKAATAAPAVGATATDPIVVVGMASRLPGGASSAEQFSQQIMRPTSLLRTLPLRYFDAAEYEESIASSQGCFLDDVDAFDPEMFGISPHEAALIDPHHRLNLEACLEALHDAGHSRKSLRHARIGVFTGLLSPSLTSDWTAVQMAVGIGPKTLSAVESSCIAGRVAYHLGLSGPAVTISTACSSSLVALESAISSINNGTVDEAVVSAVNLCVAPAGYILPSAAGMLSPNGRCATFQADADGFGRGEGAAAVVVKRLSAARRDGDKIHAEIRAVAINQDGPSAGMTAPRGPAQEACIRRAMDLCGVHPHDVSYVECHGTGTPLGDPIEVQALSQAYSATSRPSPLVLGAVKSRIGHLEAAAGLAGLISLIGVLSSRMAPPLFGPKAVLSPHLAALATTAPGPPSKVVIPAEPLELTARRPIGAVSSFGLINVYKLI